MRNDYTDYIQHAFGHRYVAKVKTANGNRYFYTQEEYDAYRNGEGLPGAFKRYDDKQAALKKGFGDALTRYRTSKKNTQKRELINGRIAGIHQTPTRGVTGAAYTAKKTVSSIGSSAKKAMTNAAASIGSKQVKNAYGPSAPVSTMASHKANQASLRGKNALAKINSAKNKVLGDPDSNSNYRVAMRKVKNTAGKVGKEFNKTFGHNEKHNNMNRVEKAVMNAQNKISTLEYKVSKKLDSLIGKNKKVSPELAAKMKGSVDDARREIVNSGADSETIKMMNDKLDKILKEIESNKTVKNTGSHPAYNQGVVSYKEYKPTQGSRPTNNQGYVPKTSTLISNPSSLPQKMREQAYLDRKARNEKNMTASQKDLQKQFNNLMTVLDRNKKKKKK